MSGGCGRHSVSLGHCLETDDHHAREIQGEGLGGRKRESGGRTKRRTRHKKRTSTIIFKHNTNLVYSMKNWHLQEAILHKFLMYS